MPRVRFVFSAAALSVGSFVRRALRVVVIATRAVHPPLMIAAPPPIQAAVVVGSMTGQASAKPRPCRRERQLQLAGGRKVFLPERRNGRDLASRLVDAIQELDVALVGVT